MRTIQTAAAASLGVALIAGAAMAGGMVEGSGTAKTETRPISGVREVSVHGVGTLTVEIGSAEGLTVTADDNILSRIETRQKGAALEIGLKEGVDLRPQTPIRYHLVVRSLDAVTLSGATQAQLPALSAHGTFRLNLSGATTVSIAHLTADSLAVDASGASRIEIGGGAARAQTVDLSGASQYKAFSLSSETVTIDASGTSGVEVTATKKLKAEASGVTRIRYRGHPSNVDADESGVSSIKAG